MNGPHPAPHPHSYWNIDGEQIGSVWVPLDPMDAEAGVTWVLGPRQGSEDEGGLTYICWPVTFHKQFYKNSTKRFILTARESTAGTRALARPKQPRGLVSAPAIQCLAISI